MVIQAQHQLLVTGADVAIVFCLIGGQKPVKVEITASEEFHAAIVEESEQFLELVRKLDPPPPDGSKASSRALSKLYPEDDGGIVPLPPEAVEWTREYQELAEQVKQLEARRDEIKNMLRAHIGPATHGLLAEPVGGKSCWRWKSQGSSRTLLALKDPPPGIRMLPPPKVPTLAEQLEESSRHVQTTTIKRKRRKARR